MAEDATPTSMPLPPAAKSVPSNAGKSKLKTPDSRKRKIGNTSVIESTNTSKQNVDNGFVFVTPNPKKRKPSAIRDFPLGCGRLAVPVTLMPANVSPHTDRAEIQHTNNKHSPEAVNKNECDNTKVSSSPPPSLVAAAVVNDNTQVSSSLSTYVAADALNDYTKASSAPSLSRSPSPPLPPPAAVVNDNEGDNIKESPSLSQSPPPHAAAANDNITDSTNISPSFFPAAVNDNTKVCSSPSSPSAAEMVICPLLTEASSPSTPPFESTSKAPIEFPSTPAIKFPSRLVSACRDFPFGCGRNAPPTTREECLKAVAALHAKSSHTPKSSQQTKPSRISPHHNAVEKRMSLVPKYDIEAAVPLASVPGNNSHEDTINLQGGKASMESLDCLQSPPKPKGRQTSMPNGMIASNWTMDMKLDNLQDGQESMDSQVPQQSPAKPKNLQISKMNGKIVGDRSNDEKLKTKAFSEHDGPIDRNMEDKSKTKTSHAHYGSGDRTINKKMKKKISPAHDDGAGDCTIDRKLKTKASPPHDGADGWAIHNKLKTKASPPHDGAEDWTINNKLQTKASPAHDRTRSGKKNPKVQAVNFALTPFDSSTSNAQGQFDADGTVTRSKVRETMRLFQVLYRKYLQEEETHTKEPGQANTRKRPDVQASQILKENNKWINTGKQIVGVVPGVEVGDEFHYRIELCIVGLHRQSQGGIDYLKQGNTIIATSVVASGAYADDVDTGEVLIYTGQGGNNSGAEKKQAEDQKLERGNLSLKNCIDAKSPVRVIRGLKEPKTSFGAKCGKEGSKSKTGITYTYDGLYLVEKYWQEKGTSGSSVFKFELRRMPGQPELAWNILRTIGKSKTAACREGLRKRDISQGKETRPISVVNTIDDESGPAPFEYTSKIIYPSWYIPTPPRGCDCVDGCSDSESCLCAIKNGGELPFNYNGAIVEAKPIVHECGPSCKCPPTCHNRVSQHGVKLVLEVFKTAKRGWGVRSLTSISSGSFICEYTGELLSDMEAEQRTGNDEYLFDIGSGSNDQSLWDGLAGLVNELPSHSIDETVEDAGYTIDAAKYGGVGRFINHSCSPNLYAQNVLYDHDDKTVPHIMLFAAENIPPLQELSYHYNYKLDQVRDSDGNIKKKNCYCGSAECTGRLY